MWLYRFSFTVLVLVVVVVLAANPATSASIRAAGVLQLLLIMSLTIFSLMVSVLLSDGEFSLAHAIGIFGFLTLHDADGLAAMTWAVAGGAMLGGAGMVARWQEQLPRRRLVQRGLENLVITTSRTTLSFYIAGTVYLSRGGALPLRIDATNGIGIVAVYIGVYLAVYAAIYALEFYLEGYSIRQVLVKDSLELAMLLILPLAFSLVAAIVTNELPPEIGALTIIALVIMVIAPFGYSRNGYLMRQQLAVMQLLAKLVQDLQTKGGMPGLVTKIETTVPQILDASHVIMGVMERDSQRLIYPVIVRNGKPMPAAQPDRADIWLITQMIAHREPLLLSEGVTEYLQQQHMPPHAESIESWMGAPMIAGERVVGALVAFSGGSRRFAEPDMRLLSIVSSTLAAAVDNRQLYELQQQRVTRLNTLNTVSVLLASTLDVDSVFDTITTAAGMLSEANQVCLFLYDEQTPHKPTIQLIRSAGTSETFSAAYSQPVILRANRDTIPDTPPTAEIPLAETPPLVVTDVNQNKHTVYMRDIFADEGIRALIELPLMGADEYIGYVGMYYDEPQMFGAEFIEFLRTFANEVVQAIRNAQLYTRTDAALEQRLVQLSILATVGQQTSASGNNTELSHILLKFVLNYTEAPRGAVALYDPQSGALSVTAQQGYPPGTFDNIAVLQQGVTGRVLQTGEVAYQQTPTNSQFMPDTASQLTLPILRDRDVLGIVLLESHTAGAFSQEDNGFLVQLVNNAAIAIDNHNLLNTVTQARDRLKVILDAISEGIVLLNQQARVIMANPAVNLIGLDHRQIVNQTLSGLVDQDEMTLFRLGFNNGEAMERFVRRLRHTTNWEQVPETHYIVHAGPNERYIQREVIAIHADDGRLMGVLMAFYDQTQKRDLDRTRDDLTRMIVHDLRTPLNAITTSLSILRRVMDPASPNNAVVNDTLDNTDEVLQKLTNRVESILDVAKMESGKLELDHNRFALRPLVDDVFAELQPLAEKNAVQLVNHVTEDTPLLLADRDKTERVLQNMVDNALKYTPDGLAVEIKANLDPDTDPPMVAIHVIDRGPGIPLEYRERLFDRFVQVKGQAGKRGGVGLGLTFCKLVVEAHAGRVWVRDNPQGGSIFTFTLPADLGENSQPTG